MMVSYGGFDKPDEIKKIITETSENLGYDRNIQGFGYVDIKSLLDLKNK